tara:strand:+ start:830 stop:1507 length:678 start_codon:yes stop_codon:yes gene_type:complete
MAEELQRPNSPNPEAEALKAEIEALKANNAKLLDENIKGRQRAKMIPEGVDVNELIAFKQKKEQEELEAKGQYEEAREKLASQYRQAEEEKNKEIEALRSEKRKLEIEAPAVTSLADVVHDPQYVLSRLNKDQLSREADGTVVVVDGYTRTPVKDWAIQQMPTWVQKHSRPQGGGASTVKASTTEFVSAGEKNPFAPDSFNLTEQSRLYRTDRNKYEMLKNAVKG